MIYNHLKNTIADSFRRIADRVVSRQMPDIYSVIAQEKQSLAVPPRRNTTSVPSITERSVCNPKPSTADAEALLNTVTATFSKILSELKKPSKTAKNDIKKFALLIQEMPHLPLSKLLFSLPNADSKHGASYFGEDCQQ